MLTRLQHRVKMKAFQFEALLGTLHCLLSQFKRPLQTLTAHTDLPQSATCSQPHISTSHICTDLTQDMKLGDSCVQ